MFPLHGRMDDLAPEHNFDSRALMCLAYFFKCYPWVFAQPTWHRQTSGRLLQELNVWTVTGACYIRSSESSMGTV